MINKDKLEKFEKFANQFVFYLLAFFTGLAAFSYLFVRAEVSLIYSEDGRFVWGSYKAWIGMLIVGTCLLVSAKWLKKISTGRLWAILALVTFSFGLYVICFSKPFLKADASSVYWGAMEINHANYQSLLGYLKEYPHQLGLVTFERLILSVVPSIRFIRGVYLLLTIGSHYFLFKLCQLFFDREHLFMKYLTLLSFAFVPMLFFIMHVYGSTPAIFFLTASLYAFARYRLDKRMAFGLASSILLVLAALVRMNYQIAVIAMLIVYLLEALNRWSWKPFVQASLLLVMFIGANKGIIAYYESISGYSLNQGMPPTYHLAMGLQDGQQRFPGWYNGYNVSTYEKYKNDPEQMKAVGKRDLRKIIHYRLSHPRSSFIFFSKKWLSTWLEPTFQSIWSGPIGSPASVTFTKILNSIYNGGVLYKGLVIFLQALVWIIYGLTAFTGWSYRKIKNPLLKDIFLFISLFFIGTNIFHIGWEAKAQYTFTHVYLLIPIAVQGLCLLMDYAGKKGYIGQKDSPVEN